MPIAAAQLAGEAVCLGLRERLSHFPHCDLSQDSQDVQDIHLLWGGKVLCGVLINPSPWFKEERHKATAGGATQVSGRHWARGSPLGVAAAELLISRKDRNEGVQDVVVWWYHPLCSGKEGVTGHKVALVVDKVRVWGSHLGALVRKGQSNPLCLPGCSFLVLIAPAAWRKVLSEQLHSSSVP